MKRNTDKAFINLEYQTLLHTKLIESLLNKRKLCQEDIELFKQKAVEAINEKYGETLLIYKNIT